MGGYCDLMLETRRSRKRGRYCCEDRWKVGTDEWKQVFFFGYTLLSLSSVGYISRAFVQYENKIVNNDVL